jgi:hypothetical protein
MNLNDLEGNTSVLADMRLLSDRELCFDQRFFPQGIEKGRLQLRIMGCIFFLTHTTSRKFLSCNSCGVGLVPKQLAWANEFVCLTLLLASSCGELN